MQTLLLTSSDISIKLVTLPFLNFICKMGVVIVTGLEGYFEVYTGNGCHTLVMVQTTNTQKILLVFISSILLVT